MAHDWDAWPLRADQCPCDIHFLEFLEAQDIGDRTIFHFGTGAHHIVGVRTAASGRNDVVLGITNAPREHEAYVALALADPNLGRFYQVLFGDIHLTDARLLPGFDVVTLFHLGEYRDESHALHALTDLDLVLLLTGKLRVGGALVFYTGSVAFRAAEAVIAEVERRGLIEPAGAYKTLAVYRRLPGPPEPSGGSAPGEAEDVQSGRRARDRDADAEQRNGDERDEVGTGR